MLATGLMAIVAQGSGSLSVIGPNKLVANGSFDATALHLFVCTRCTRVCLHSGVPLPLIDGLIFRWISAALERC